VMSDHGFCTLKSEVQLSRFLIERGWTALGGGTPKHPLDIDPGKSRVYSLIPGRIYVNVRGREPAGIVSPEDYDKVRAEVTAELLALRAPNGDKVIRKVLKREELYWPDGADAPNPDMSVGELLETDSAFGLAADLIAVPFDGYDLKMGLAQSEVYVSTELEGMHTYHDALILARGVELPSERFSIYNVTRHMLRSMDVEPPGDMD